MPDAFKGVGLEEHLGGQIPLHLVFRDEAGKPVRLGAYIDGKKPVLLNLVYHNCPMLCNLILDGQTRSLRAMDWTPGDQFDIVTVSFSAQEGPDLAARQKALYLKRLGKPGAEKGWHFLTGDQASIQALARSVGFQFKWVEQQQEFAHPAVLTFVSPTGRISRYLYGLEHPPRNIRNALVEASEGKVGTTIDRLILYCFHYDPSANSYVVHATNLMKLGGILTMLVLGSVLFMFWRREGRREEEISPVV